MRRIITDQSVCILRIRSQFPLPHAKNSPRPLPTSDSQRASRAPTEGPTYATHTLGMRSSLYPAASEHALFGPAQAYGRDPATRCTSRSSARPSRSPASTRRGAPSSRRGRAARPAGGSSRGLTDDATVRRGPGRLIVALAFQLQIDTLNSKRYHVSPALPRPPQPRRGRDAAGGRGVVRSRITPDSSSCASSHQLGARRLALSRARCTLPPSPRPVGRPRRGRDSSTEKKTKTTRRSARRSAKP